MMTWATKFRRLLATLLLLVAVSPALAVIPLGFGVGLLTGISQTSLTIPALIASVGIGGAVAFVTFHDSSGTPTASNQTLSVSINPKAEPPKRPAGWSDPAPGEIQPQAPASTSTQPASQMMLWRVQNAQNIVITSGHNSSATACAAWAPTSYPSGGYYSQLGSWNGFNCLLYSNAGALQGGAYTQSYTGTGCPAGYTLNGSNCTQTIPAGPATKPADGHCTILRTGNAFISDPYDPDCNGPSPGDGSTVTISGDSSSVIATRPDGSSIHVNLQPDGSSVIVDTRPDSTGTKTQVSMVNISSPDPTTGEATVTGKTKAIYEGTGAFQSATPTQNVTFDKSGLSTESTSQGIKGTLDDISTKLDSVTGSVPGAAPSAADRGWGADLDKTKDGSMFDGIKTTLSTGWGFDTLFTASVCSPITGNVHGASMSLDICPAVDSIRMLLGFVIYAITLFLVFRIFTSVT